MNIATDRPERGAGGPAAAGPPACSPHAAPQKRAAPRGSTANLPRARLGARTPSGVPQRNQCYSPERKMRAGEPVRGPPPGPPRAYCAAPPPPSPAGPRRQSPTSLIRGPHPLRHPQRDPYNSPERKMRTGEHVRGPAAGAAAGFLCRPPAAPPRPRGTAMLIVQALYNVPPSLCRALPDPDQSLKGKRATGRPARGAGGPAAAAPPLPPP